MKTTIFNKIPQARNSFSQSFEVVYSKLLESVTRVITSNNTNRFFNRKYLKNSFGLALL